MYNINETINPTKVVEHGEKLYKLSKIFIFIGACAVALAVFMSLIGLMLEGGYFYLMFVFDVTSDYTFVIPLVILVYLGIIIGFTGIPMYYSSLQIYSLGKIAQNTENK